MPINTRHPDYARQAPYWEICRDLAEGEVAVKARRSKYLPVLEGQSGEADAAYTAYLTRAMLYPAFDRTVTGLSGMVLRRPVTVHCPKTITPLLDDLTLEREGGMQGVLVRALREVMTTGRLVVLVDWNEALQRPYWTIYDTEQVINWRETRINGIWTPSMVVFEEKVLSPDADAYSAETITQWREFVLDPNGVLHVRIWRKASAAVDADVVVVNEIIPTRRGVALNEIPVVSLTPRGSGMCPPKPPLLDLALVNISHYRSSADLEHGRHFTALPTPWVTGWTGDATGGGLKIGAGTAWVIPPEQAKVGMLEFTGAGLGALERALEQKEHLMASIGARLLEQQPRAAETAEAVRLRQGGDHTSLATLVSSVSAGLTFALQWCGWWLGIANALGGKDIEARLNTDFIDTQLSAPEIDALMKLWQAGGISYETLYYNLQAGEVARPGIDVEEEREQIDAEDALKPEPTEPVVPPTNPDDDEGEPSPSPSPAAEE